MERTSGLSSGRCKSCIWPHGSEVQTTVEGHYLRVHWKEVTVEDPGLVKINSKVLYTMRTIFQMLCEWR